MSAMLRKIEAFEIQLPLPRPLRLGAITIAHREYALVYVYDNEGNRGSAHGLTRNAPVSATLMRTVAPFWEGKRLDDHEEFYRLAVKVNSSLGTNGIFWRALSLADCALYDLLAIRANLPLGEYLGGKIRTVPANLIGGYPTSDETEETLAREMRELSGYAPQAIKLASCSDYARDTQRLRTCRSAIPDGSPLILDLYSHAENVEALLQEARRWEPLNMAWVEDPFGMDDYQSLAELVSVLQIPVAAGDEQSGFRHFRRLIEEGQVGILRLDATVCGGVRAFIEITEMAARHQVPVAAHVFHHVHCQLACALPNVKWVEYFLPHHGYESIQLVWGSDLRWENGGLALTDKPGIGYDWNEAAIRSLRC